MAAAALMPRPRPRALPPPPVPADACILALPAMMVDVVPLRDCDEAETEDAQVFKFMVLAWAAAWHQSPAGSLPSDETKLLRLIRWQSGLNAFRAFRAAGGFPGWSEHSDHRLYHPILTKKVIEAINSKRLRSERTESARAAKKSPTGLNEKATEEHPGLGAQHDEAQKEREEHTPPWQPVGNAHPNQPVTEAVESAARPNERNNERNKEASSSAREPEVDKPAPDAGTQQTESLSIFARLTGDNERVAAMLLKDVLAVAKGDAGKLLEALREAEANPPPDARTTLTGWLRARFLPPPPDCPALHRAPSRMPALNDAPHLWSDFAATWQVDEAMMRRPVFAGYYFDQTCGLLCEAAGIHDKGFRCDWRPALRWLLDGIETPHIVDAIKRVANRPNYTPPRSLGYFDAMVRAPSGGAS